MHVKPNTPVLPFEPNTPAPKDADELASVIDWFWTYALCDGGDTSQQAAAQAAASLELVRWFSWPKPSRDQRTLRKSFRSLRAAQRAWFSTFGGNRAC